MIQLHNYNLVTFHVKTIYNTNFQRWWIGRLLFIVNGTLTEQYIKN